MEEVLVKYFAGEATIDERKSVESWRSDSEENAKSFLEFKKIWLASTPKESPNGIMLEQILASDEEIRIEVQPIWTQKLFKLAAAVIIGLGVVFAVLKKESTQPYGEVVAEVTEFKLPDGSVATLQRGASITIGDFETTREVDLHGKAFFDVTKNPNKPFIVTTKNASVQVLGTSFLVNAPENAASVEVMVSTGKVAFAQRSELFGSDALKIDLVKGEMGIIKLGEKGIKKKNIKDENHLSWKTKDVSFKRSNLNEVSNMVADMYDVKFSFAGVESGNCTLTAQFEDKNPAEMADIIAKTFDFEVKQVGTEYIFSGAGCQ